MKRPECFGRGDSDSRSGLRSSPSADTPGRSVARATALLRLPGDRLDRRERVVGSRGSARARAAGNGEAAPSSSRSGAARQNRTAQRDDGGRAPPRRYTAAPATRAGRGRPGKREGLRAAASSPLEARRGRAPSLFGWWRPAPRAASGRAAPASVLSSAAVEQLEPVPRVVERRNTPRRVDRFPHDQRRSSPHRPSIASSRLAAAQPCR